MYLKPSAVILFVLFQLLYVVSSNVEEGSPCTIKDGTKGICKKRSECYHATEDLINFVLPTFCSFSIWNPIVCCLDCRFIQNRFFEGLTMKMSFNFQMELVIADNVETDQKHCLEGFDFACNKFEKFKDLDDSVRCYESPYTKEEVVIGAYDPRRDGYPHMALIGYGDKPLNAEWVCSGAIINEYFILSAAHCTSSLSLGAMQMAALGVTNRTAGNPRSWQIYEFVKIITHPNYVPPSKYHDIALLMTGAKIRFNQDVIPACLYRGVEMPKGATALGWGVMGSRNWLTGILKGVNIFKLSRNQCMDAYPAHRFLLRGYDRSTQVCYGDAEQINDSCQGDSGGPLQIRTNLKPSKCLHVITGITAYGRACGSFGSSGLYTRVSIYVPWIESIAGKLS